MTPHIPCFIVLLGLASVSAETLFREDFLELPAHTPVTSDDLSSGFLELERIGTAADRLKLSHHPEVPNDPHYIWNGDCRGPVLIGFPFRKTVDLSGDQWVVNLRTKNVGKSTLHLALRSGEKWIVQEEPVANQNDWNVQSLKIDGGTWRALDPKRVSVGSAVRKFDRSRIDAIGFVAPKRPNRSKDCIRLDWFELVTAKPKSQLPTGSFLENETPFLRTALVGDPEDPGQLIRRGVLVPVGEDHWACFDPDLLRWAAFWKAQPGAPPLTYDSMAAVSFPNAKAKATRAPRLQGSAPRWLPAQPGGATGTRLKRDPRRQLAGGTHLPVGPLPVSYGRWMGVSLSDTTPILHYRIGKTEVSETITTDSQGTIWRMIGIGPSPESLSFFVDPQSGWKLHGTGATLSGNRLAVPKRSKKRWIKLSQGKSKGDPPAWPSSHSATPLPGNVIVVESTQPKAQGPLSVRDLQLPESTRPVRPSDLAFRSDGTAFISTLDGDIWQVRDLEGTTAHWRRIATGLFEPMGIEVWEDRLFVLGRDQITELVDTNQDGTIDVFRNASDAFLQTLHTRDFATSLDIKPDGSFIVAKGGISSFGKQTTDENSPHRGAILQISSDGNSVRVLADGLRMPFGGLRSDGVTFSSDQQGHFVPSTPIHRINDDVPYLGFEPTDHRTSKKPRSPLLFYPYQTNRSAAGFANIGATGFTDFADSFVQISWNGRVFGIVSADTGHPFSWQWPVQLDFPSLKGATHPESGRLYVTGLGISAYKATTPKPYGLASIGQASPFPTPQGMTISRDKVEVTFNRPLRPNETVIPANPAVRMFDVKRSKRYGSGHFRWDGKPGEHQLRPKRFTLSRDRRVLILTFDALRHAEILDLHLSVSVDEQSIPLHLFARPNHLPKATSAELTAMAKLEANQPKMRPGDPARGKSMFAQYACAVCHSLANEKLTGPPLKGIGSRHDAAFIRESILEPAAKVADGYEPAMPSFDGVIPAQDLADLVAFLESLKSP